MARKRDYVAALDKRISEAIKGVDYARNALSIAEVRLGDLRAAKADLEKVGQGGKAAKPRKSPITIGGPAVGARGVSASSDSNTKPPGLLASTP